MGESRLQALAFIIALVVIPLGALGSEPPPPWAFAVTPANYVPPADDGSIRHVPGSAKGYTQTQIDDNFNAPDWFPSEHRPMPRVVAHGDGTMVWACAKCHLASGLGHPESAGLAGLPAAYITEQIADYKDGSRKGSPKMAQIAKAMSAEDVAQAAKWFSQLPRRPWVRVVQTATVPVTFIADGSMRLPSPGSKTEPLGDRIIELPLDAKRAQSRDPHSSYIAYVPPGSVDRGKVLVTTGGGGKTVACANCHGASLTGMADIPPIAGRSPVYIFRQLYNFQTGARRGPRTLMKAVVSRLTNHDMLVISAYLASLQP